MSVYQVWQWTTSASRLSFAIARLRWSASSAPANRGSVFSFAPAQGRSRGRAAAGASMTWSPKQRTSTGTSRASSRLRYSTWTPAPPYTFGGYSFVNSATLSSDDTRAPVVIRRGRVRAGARPRYNEPASHRGHRARRHARLGRWTNPLRFHVLLIPNVGWTELRDRVLRLERLGVEVAALPDHLVDWSRPVSPWFESWTSLAALADATTTIRLATSVTQITLRNPAMLARQVLTLDHISNGRIELGLGTGLLHDPSYAMAGLPDWDAEGAGGPVRGVRPDRGDDAVAGGDDLRGPLLSSRGRGHEPSPGAGPRPPIAVAGLARG